MGIQKFFSVAEAMVRSLRLGAGAGALVAGAPGCGVLALDANAALYWAYGSLLGGAEVRTDAAGRHTTTLKFGEVLQHVEKHFLAFLTNLVEVMRPEVLLIALDGVPPTAKIMDQRARRIDAPPTDLHDPEGRLVFTTAWLCPNSELLGRVDAALSRHPARGRLATIYSGPGVPGEGEHKLYPILQALARHGLGALPAEPAPPAGAPTPGGRAHWRPRNVYILGNDNDLYLLSALFLASFERDAPAVYLYNDRATREEISKAAGTPRAPAEAASGVVLPSQPSQLQLFDVQLLVNAICGDGRFGCPGESRLARVAHFVYIAALLGNDFVPRINLGADVSPPELMAALCESLRAARRPLLPPLELPREVAVPALPYYRVVPPADALTQGLLLVQETVAASRSVTPAPPAPTLPAENLAALAHANGVRPEHANRLALAAACEYLRMMGNVLSYYLSSTCSVPRSVLATPPLTMPAEYYGYMLAPPALNYLTAAAQVLAAHQRDGAKEYPRARAALAEFTLSGVLPSEEPRPAPFPELGFHSAMVFPARTLPAPNIPPSATALAAAGYPGLFPLSTGDRSTNPSLLPGTVLRQMEADYAANAAQFPRIKLTPAVLATLTESDESAERKHYVPDSLLPA